MTAPLQLIPRLEPIRSEMEQVEHLLHETLKGVEEPLHSMLSRSLCGGKRLRAALVILAGQMFVPSSAPFFGLAAAVEMLHVATLIHDDLVDESPMRRGHKTLHATWSAGAAVLAGDYLLAQATALIAELKHPRILGLFAEALCTLCAGEIKQMFPVQGKRKQREDYYLSIEAKTASLFAAAIEMAGILAEAREPEIAALRRFARELGISFQIVDDVLDLTSNESQLGKPAGSDLRQGLLTLPALYYLEQVQDDAAISAVLSGQYEEQRVQAAIEAICSSGAIEASLAEARAHARQGQEALATLPDSAARQMLYSLTEYVVQRRR